MILHCVFCKFLDEISQKERSTLLSELAAFAGTLNGVIGFEHGPNRDFEGKSAGFTDGFVIQFSDPEALSQYAVHPTHVKLGKRLCDMCVGGADGIIVFDIETNTPLNIHT